MYAMTQGNSTAKDNTMMWKGRTLSSVGEILLAMEKIIRENNQQEAEAFVKAYADITPHARKNLGYLTGYLDPVSMKKAFELFGVEHPFFGTRVPTPREAFELGKKWSWPKRG